MQQPLASQWVLMPFKMQFELRLPCGNIRVSIRFIRSRARSRDHFRHESHSLQFWSLGRFQAIPLGQLAEITFGSHLIFSKHRFYRFHGIPFECCIIRSLSGNFAICHSISSQRLDHHVILAQNFKISLKIMRKPLKPLRHKLTKFEQHHIHTHAASDRLHDGRVTS